MTLKKGPAGAEHAGPAVKAADTQNSTFAPTALQAKATLFTILDGARWATAIRDNGRPGRIMVPADPAERAALIDAHLTGSPAVLTFHRADGPPWAERVAAVVLGCYTPAADGLCHWVAVDLDATDGHGARGLVDPLHAARCIAERTYNAGLGGGLLVARSKSGRGVHVWLILPAPVPLADAVLGVAALAAAALRVAGDDVHDAGGEHAFRRGDGSIARPGDAGGVELYPRSGARPACGWSLTLPGAGAFAHRGGGVVIDPFTNEPCQLPDEPRCDATAWVRHVDEARAELQRRSRRSTPRPAPREPLRASTIGISNRTHDFINGRINEGSRNLNCFSAACNLLGCGIDPAETERLILHGARACGLPEREARAALASASRAVSPKGVRSWSI